MTGESVPMTTLTHEFKASYAFMERNYFIVKRYWAWEMVWLTYSIVNSLSVSYIGVGMEKLGGEGIDSDFLVLYLAIGTIVWRYLAVIFYWVTDVIGMERWELTGYTAKLSGVRISGRFDISAESQYLYCRSAWRAEYHPQGVSRVAYKVARSAACGVHRNGGSNLRESGALVR